MVFRFHKNSIILDTLQILKRNQLVQGKLSLFSICENYLNSASKKMNLDSVLIRKIYIIDEFTTTDITNRKRISSAVHAIDNNDSSRRPEYSEEGECSDWNYNQFQYNLLKINKSLIDNDVTWKNMNEYRNYTMIPTLEYILAYNIMDCVSVFKIIDIFNVINLIRTQAADLYNMDLESASYYGNSLRVGSCLAYSSLEYGQFMCLTNFDSNILIPINKHEILNEKSNSIFDYTCTDKPIRMSIQCNITKKNYQGALVYASSHVGIHNKVSQFDFSSYYPNIIIWGHLGRDTIDWASVELLLEVINCNRVWRQMDTLIAQNIINIYLNTDPENTTVEQMLKPTYNGRGIAHHINNIQELTHLPPNTVCIIKLTKGTNFLPKLLKRLLHQRAEARKKLKAATLIEEEKLYDAYQLSFKITNNSVYGLYGASTFKFKCIPAAAACTLFARKYIMYICQISFPMYYLEYLNVTNENEITLLSGGTILNRQELLLLFHHLRKYGCFHKIATDKCLSRFETLALTLSTTTSIDDLDKKLQYSDSIIIDIDTDGFQIANPLNINMNTFLTNLNNELKLITEENYFELEGSPEYDTIVLAKKKYLRWLIPLTMEKILQHPNIDLLTISKVLHKGYEKIVIYILNE